jgi:hypothetical protein
MSAREEFLQKLKTEINKAYDAQLINLDEVRALDSLVGRMICGMKISFPRDG